jgi:hypothetical protein
MVNVRDSPRQSYNHREHMAIKILLTVIQIGLLKMVTILRLSIVDVGIR